MDKREFTEIISSFEPDDDVKERIEKKVFSAENICKKSKKSTKKVAAILVCIVAAVVSTTTVFADEIRSALYSIFGNDNIISEDISENIYEDNDGHVDFSVSKVVSDGMNSYAIVKYTAVDDLGTEWVAEHFDRFVDENGEPLRDEEGYIIREYYEKMAVYITPDWTNDHFEGYTYSIPEEITDETEENSRVFKVWCHATDTIFGTNSIKLNYDMTDEESKSAFIDFSESVELIDIKLDSSKAPEKYYIPTGVKFSSLGIMVYGMNNGLYGITRNDAGGYHVWSLHEGEDIEPDIEIITKDSSKIPIHTFCYSGSIIDLKKDYDTGIYTGWFEEPVDTDNISGIILDGVYYEFSY